MTLGFRYLAEADLVKPAMSADPLGCLFGYGQTGLALEAPRNAVAELSPDHRSRVRHVHRALFDRPDVRGWRLAAPVVLRRAMSFCDSTSAASERS